MPNINTTETQLLLILKSLDYHRQVKDRLKKYLLGPVSYWELGEIGSRREGSRKKMAARQENPSVCIGSEKSNISGLSTLLDFIHLDLSPQTQSACYVYVGITKMSFICSLFARHLQN